MDSLTLSYNQGFDIIPVYCTAPNFFNNIGSFDACLVYPNMTRDLNQHLFPSDTLALAAGYTKKNEIANNVTSYVTTCLSQWCNISSSCANGTSDLCHQSRMAYNNLLLWEPVYDCLEATCLRPFAPTIDPDIGGIGVMTSYFVQIGISILGFIAILFCKICQILAKERDRKRLRPLITWNTFERHIQIIITHLVDFQKIQCWFALVLQIAGLRFIMRPGRVNFVNSGGIISLCEDGTAPILHNLGVLLFFPQDIDIHVHYEPVHCYTGLRGHVAYC